MRARPVIFWSLLVARDQLATPKAGALAALASGGASNASKPDSST